VSFLREKQNCESLIFIYEMTLGKLCLFTAFLEKVDQFGWLGTPTRSSPFSLVKLGTNHMTDHSGSWMKMMSNSFCASKIVLVSNLFFWTFCKKILILFWILFPVKLMLLEWTEIRVTHLKVCEHSSSCLVSSLGELVFALVLQHYAKWWWYLVLWGWLHFTHLKSWILHEKVACPHFQQFLYCNTSNFMSTLWIVAI